MYADYLLLISSTCNDLRSVVELRKKQWATTLSRRKRRDITWNPAQQDNCFATVSQTGDNILPKVYRSTGCANKKFL